MYCFQRACRLWFQVTRRWNFKRWLIFLWMFLKSGWNQSGKAKVSLLIDFGQVKICISGKFRRCLIDHKSFNLQQPVPLQELYRLVEVKTTKTVQMGLKFQTFHELYKIVYHGYKMIWKSVSAVFSINTKQVNNRENQRKVTSIR